MVPETKHSSLFFNVCRKKVLKHLKQMFFKNNFFSLQFSIHLRSFNPFQWKEERKLNWNNIQPRNQSNKCFITVIYIVAFTICLTFRVDSIKVYPLRFIQKAEFLFAKLISKIQTKMATMARTALASAIFRIISICITSAKEDRACTVACSVMLSPNKNFVNVNDPSLFIHTMAKIALS